MIKLYGLKNCDSCRKALKMLTTAGHDAELIDVRAAPLTAIQLELFLDAFGDALVNTRSTTWRQMSDEARSEPPIDALLANPSLMKRPVIVDGDTKYLGWGKDVQAALLGNAGTAA